MSQAINLLEKFALFTDQWQPKVIAEMNDYQFKLARLEGEFVWHSHADTDETFFVIDGELRIAMREGQACGEYQVQLNAGEIFVVPRGREHKPIAAQEVLIMLIEPKGVLNTGDAKHDRRAPNDAWI